MKDFTTKRKVTSYDNAGFLSKLFFAWVTPVFIRSFNKILSEDEIFDLPLKDTTANLTLMFEREWQKELNNKYPSLMKSVCRLFWKRYLLLGILLLSENSFSLLQSIIIGRLLLLSKTFEENVVETIVYASFLLVTVVCVVLIRNPYLFHSFKIGMQLKIGLGGMVYRKLLKMNQKSVGQTSIGHIVNLLSTDLTLFELSIPQLHYIWLGPFTAIAAVSILYWFSKEGALAVIFIFIILVPIQIGLGKVYLSLRSRVSVLTDERIKLISELINGIKVLKMFCWEPMYSKVVKQLRKKILIYDFLRKLAKSLEITLRFSGGRFVMMSFLTCVVLRQISLSFQVIWITVILINQIRGTVVDRFAIGINHCTDLFVTFDRLQKFLTLSEYNDKIYPNSIFSCKTGANDHLPSEKDVFVTFDDVSASWNDNLDFEETLNHVSFHLQSPQICAIVGEIGSGKSSILMALLGELPLNKGSITYQGSLSYTSQLPWILSGTIQQNILLDNLMVDDIYLDILRATTLDQDIELMECGDNTNVGERGLCLSGGQKARIALARATLINADIILLDDPLAAVDASVGYKIFTDCIKSHFKDKLVLLVTNQMHLLKNVDKVLVLNEGKILVFGTFDELVSKGLNFKSITESKSNINFEEIQIKQDSNDDWREKDYQVDLWKSTQEKAPLLVSVSLCKENNIELTKSSNRRQLLNDGDRLEWFSHRNITLKLFWKYFTVACPSICGIMVFVLYSVTMFLYVFCDIWLLWWSMEIEKRNVSDQDYFKNDRRYLVGFVALSMSTFVSAIVSVIFLFQVCLFSSKALHEKMLHAILYSPMNFFDENSAGSILNRFSKDINIADNLLPITIQEMILTIGLVLFGLGMSFYKNYWSIIVVVPLFLVLWCLRKSFVNVQCCLKRFEAVTRSPLFGQISYTVQGLTTIRALKLQNWFFGEFQRKQDRHCRAFFFAICTNRWFAFRLDEICTIYIIVVTFSSLALLNFKKINATDFGFILTYIVGTVSLTQWAIRQSTEVENQMISIERICEYISLPSENLTAKELENENWPERGEIKFKNVSLSYKKTWPMALKDINLTIDDEEKIGIIGRTGAGKSSLISLLFRLVELPPGCGKIIIDGQDISCLRLQRLRSKISVIPQDPVLFMGNIRMNLDPFNEFNDDDLWKVLETVHLKNTVDDLPRKLDNSVSEGGSNLSVGQRQLICMARALLKKTRIIIMDEATANVDPSTDEVIQKTLKNTFAHCTVLTVAHRLSTIMDSDRILVMDNGRVEEFDHPFNLFKNYPDALFCKMVKQTGPIEEEKLRKIAELNFLRRKGKC